LYPGVSEPLAAPTYAELAARVQVQDQVIAELRCVVEELRAEVAALRRQVGRDSSNSSLPPSQNGPGVKGKVKAERRSGGSAQRPKRAQGGQKGHRGAGLARVADPDKTVVLEPSACGGCGADLAGAPGRVGAGVQVFDLPTFGLEVTEYLMMRRVCGGGRLSCRRRRGAGCSVSLSTRGHD
jgi:transposase